MSPEVDPIRRGGRVVHTTEVQSDGALVDVVMSDAFDEGIDPAAVETIVGLAVTDVIDSLPPKTWDVSVWTRGMGQIPGRIDPADVRRIVAAILGVRP